jgi:tRNA-splicing ligase RtcB
MPDAHAGYSLPIGAVVATEDHILPSWVGYDIGCGMCALPTTFDCEAVRKQAKIIFDGIYNAVPTGPKNNNDPVESILNPRDLSDIGQEAFDRRGGFFALGSLGGGNHFIEIGVDENNIVWIIIHSGSRGPGHGIAGSYMRLASGDGKAREGNYSFTSYSELGKKYINDLNWVLEFALQNCREIIRRVETVIASVVSGEGQWGDLINRNHNHAEQNQDGWWVHRKGATHAEKT